MSIELRRRRNAGGRGTRGDVVATLVVVVWVLWAVLGGGRAVGAVLGNWPVSVTMAFGSLVGGGTSEGGGAVAFPILTKVLAVPPGEARLFTYAVQAVGMVGAAIVILASNVPVEDRILRVAAPAGVLGVVVSVVWIAPLVPGAGIRLMFTAVLVGLAVALVVQHRDPPAAYHQRVPRWGAAEVSITAAAGFVGGVLSGVVGVGENTVLFLVLVLLFKVSDKVATPTTVVLLALVSVAAFAVHLVVLRDVPPVVVDRWLAAVPVVVVGAPIGAIICTRLSREAIRRILLVLIAAELVSTLLLVPLTGPATVPAVAVLVLTTALCLFLTARRRYDRAEARGA